MAKGVEDTAFYRWTRFVALNEVGGDPAAFSGAAGGVPRAAPRSARPLAGHDDHAVHPRHQARRGRPGPARRAGRAAGRAGRERSTLAGRCAPAARPGVRPACSGRPPSARWPIERERLHAYAEKADREAGDRDQLDRPRPGLRAGACTPWSTRLYDDPSLHGRARPSSLARDHPGRLVNSLGQKLVSSPCPGVPDIYQGTELWDNSLVDPDNRRPVDFAVRRRAGPARRRRPSAVDADGAAKLLVVAAQRCGCAGTDPELFTGLPAGAGRRAGRRARGRLRPGRRDRRGRPGCRWAWRRPAAGVTHAVTSVHGVADLFTGRVYSGAERSLDDLLADYPVALLAPSHRCRGGC